MRIGLHVLCFVALASFATAQPSYVDHRTYPADFATITPGDPVAEHPGLVWRHDGKGWYWETAGTPTPDARSLPPLQNLPPECIPWPNPYTEPDRIIACREAQKRVIVIKPSTFRVRAIYKDPYDTQRMAVLNISRSLEDVEVVTAQWLTDDDIHDTHRAGDVFAFRATDYGAALWRELKVSIQ